ncbi:DUF1800 domain-containing protein [Parvularcula lutaonensis]|uniref:DUF1800 family protein n=1 Tax=Parvularcula lutaonensis TaxID=491923 RepID=A0ABV7MGK7_9PROT|nr:DUF1800 domain-containing protein [Parvularcula lutaonensis]GGY55696.1 hypothetical protein GCM10007148_27010 [Parvularcula lutaonensis]
MATRTGFARIALTVMACISLAACGGGGGGDTGGGTPPPTGGGGGGQTPPPAPQPASDAFETEDKTARFLAQATFGPTPQDIATLTGTDAVDWILAEFDKPVTLSLPITQDLRQRATQTFDGQFYTASNTNAFWTTALTADDQLRQRVAFALSEIFVVSNAPMGVLFDYPDGIASYHDILKRNAFGNYRELIEEITYSPPMGFYLTYAYNQKADPSTGRMPDENYAREILQLFSIGVVPLNRDGSVQQGAGELYDNTDITGLARVFTGLVFDGEIERFFGRDDAAYGNQVLARPMVTWDAIHEAGEKNFLGTTIPAGTNAAASVDAALDTIANHPNVAPFLARQLIQRLVSSDPEPDYIDRVAAAFEQGSYALPGGTQVGTGKRGDLKATVAAVLFDRDARDTTSIDPNRSGKIREPIIRFTNWARAFGANVAPEYVQILWFIDRTGPLGQHPFRSPSVFNFFRPGYIAPGTQSGAAGLTVPELQITNSATIPGYANFMTAFVFGGQVGNDTSGIADLFAREGVTGYNDAEARAAFQADLSAEVALADDIPALLDHLDTKLTYGQLTPETRALITEAIQGIDVSGPGTDEELLVARIAVLMILTSPDFVVQR